MTALCGKPVEVTFGGEERSQPCDKQPGHEGACGALFHVGPGVMGPRGAIVQVEWDVFPAFLLLGEEIISAERVRELGLTADAKRLERGEGES